MPLKSYESNKKISDYKVVVVFIPRFLSSSSFLWTVTLMGFIYYPLIVQSFSYSIILL